jgi:hypothetical protein
MEINDASEPQFSPQVANDLMSLARWFGHNNLITSFTPQQDVPGRQENVPELLPELDRHSNGARFEGNLVSIRGSLTDLQRDISVTREAFGDDLKRILSELEKMTEKVKQQGASAR